MWSRQRIGKGANSGMQEPVCCKDAIYHVNQYGRFGQTTPPPRRQMRGGLWKRPASFPTPPPTVIQPQPARAESWRGGRGGRAVRGGAVDNENPAHAECKVCGGAAIAERITHSRSRPTPAREGGVGWGGGLGGGGLPSALGWGEGAGCDPPGRAARREACAGRARGVTRGGGAAGREGRRCTTGSRPPAATGASANSSRSA